MQEILKLREKKNVLLAVVLFSLYCRKGNITDVMLMGAIKLPNQDADLRCIRLGAAEILKECLLWEMVHLDIMF